MNLPKLNHLLEKEMSRKEFLQHVGVITLGVIGLSALMSRFSQSIDYQPKQKLGAQNSNGYGIRSYGR